MIVALVLSFFLIMASYVVSSLQSSSSTSRFITDLYTKQQAYHALTSILPYILQGLRREDPSVDTLSDPWAFPFIIETERGTLEVEIHDEERFLNLNYVGSSKIHREVFERLLSLLRISPGYTDRLLAWIGKSPSVFESEHPIKRAPMDSTYELRFLGMDEEELYGRTEGDVSYPGLLELVTVHSSGKINVNTAPKYILMALDPRIDSALADKIIEHRNSKPFKKVDDLVLVEGMSFDILYRIRAVIDVKSSHFRIVAKVKRAEVQTTVEMVYDRSANRVLYRELY